MTKTPKNIIEEQTRLEAIKNNHKSLKELCIALSNPMRENQYDYYSMFDEKAKSRSNRAVRRVYDPTAFRGLEIWTNGIMGHYMPQEINWFAEEMGDRSLKDSKRVRKWLQETDEHLQGVLRQSNYYEQKKVAVSDSASDGDSFMLIDQDKESGKLLMLTPHPREFWISYDYWGRVRHIHHRFTKTIRDVKEEFGDAALSRTQKLALKESPNTNVEIIHGVYKNSDYQPDKAGTINMPWQHYYINVTSKDTPDGILMRQTGTYKLNPIPWSLNRPSHESYGRGIVAQMLIEILTCNYMSKDVLIASQVAARPPMLVPAALKHKIDFGAGGKTFVNNKEMLGLKMGDLVSRLVDSSGYPFGQDNHLRWQNMVDERFGVPLFLGMNMDTTTKTAYETRQRLAERAVMMAPFLGTLGTTTDMEFDRIYSLELEAGRAPEIPDEVLEAQDQRVDINYIGPLSQLLKQYYETGNLLTTISNIQAVLSVAPDSAIVVEGDELMRKILQSGNTPEDIILSPEDVQEIRAIAAAQQEAEMLAKQLPEMSKAVPNLSKKIESDSVLSGLMDAA